MIASIIAYTMSGFFGLLAIAGVAIAFSNEQDKVSVPRLVAAIALFGFIAWLFAYLGGI